MNYLRLLYSGFRSSEVQKKAWNPCAALFVCTSFCMETLYMLLSKKNKSQFITKLFAFVIMSEQMNHELSSHKRTQWSNSRNCIRWTSYCLCNHPMWWWSPFSHWFTFSWSRFELARRLQGLVWHNKHSISQEPFVIPNRFCLAIYISLQTFT